MPELLQYSFAVVGADNVERALASLERRFAQHNAKMNAMFGGRPGGAAGGRGAPGPRSSGGEGMAGAAAVREQTALLKKVEREAIASAKRVERERIQSEKNVAREQQKQQDYWAKARQMSAAREAEILQQQAAARADFVRSTVGKGFGRVMSGIKAVGTAGLALTGVGGAALAASSVSQALTLDEKTRRLAISARGAKEEDQFSPAQIQKLAQQNAIATGARPEDLIDASQAYVGRTGDLKGALGYQKTFATFAQATGSSNEEVASVGADLSMKFGITGVKEMGDALAVLGFQGKKGAFEIRDMANTFPEMAAAAQRAGLKGVQGMKTLGGLAQIARQSTGSGAEASTALQMMLTQLIAKSGDLKSGKSLGGKAVNVFEGGDPTKDARDLPTVLAEVISKSHGNLQQLGELFDVRGIRAASPLVSTYKSAAESTTGTAAQKEAAGKAAILKSISDASNAPGDFSDIQKDAADAMKSANVQFEILSTQLKEVVASELFPDFIALAKELPNIIGPVKSLTHLLVRLAETIADHPLASLGTVLAAAVAAEVLKAQLGKVLEGAVSKLTGGDGAGLPGFGGVGTNKSNGASMMGTVGAAGTGLAAGLTIASAIYFTGVAKFENAQFSDKQAGAALNDIRGLGYSDADISKGRADLKTITSNREDAEKPGFFQSIDMLTGYGPSKLSGATDDFFSNDKEHRKTSAAFEDEARQRLAAIESLNTLSKSLTAAHASVEEFDKRMAAAAERLGVKINTGNSPSPVKP